MDSNIITSLHFTVGMLVWCFFIWYNKKNNTLSLTRFNYSIMIPLLGYLSLFILMVWICCEAFTKLYKFIK